MSKIPALLKALGVCSLVIVTSCLQETQEDLKPATMIEYNHYEDIPQILRKGLHSTATREKYVSQVVQFIKKNSHSKKFLSHEDLEKMLDTVISKAQKTQVSTIRIYDSNLDNLVTPKEFANGILKESPRLQKDYLRHELYKKKITFHCFDENRDSVLTLTEMNTLTAEQLREIKHKNSSLYKEYLFLDPNSDGRLTVRELEILAQKAFDVVDTNRDGTIPWEEAKRTIRIKKNKFTVPTFCQLPAVAEGTKLVSIGIQEGESISSVTATGQDYQATAVTVNIEKDVPPLYLILESYDPTMWQFSGNINAINHITLHSYYKNENYFTSSGVVGIPKEKVTFLYNTCLPSYTSPPLVKSVNSATNLAIKQMVGRIPDLMSGHYAIGSLSISSEKVTSQSFRKQKEETQKVVPKGYNSNMWRELIRFYPGGVTEIVPETVVAQANVETYTVLPHQAGLAKLVYDGFIIPYRPSSTDTFRILKDIPRYPAHLNGAHLVKFHIGKGVKTPKGNPGHSRVISEEAEKKMIDGERNCQTWYYDHPVQVKEKSPLIIR